jgi:hypothetical protein
MTPILRVAVASGLMFGALALLPPAAAAQFAEKKVLTTPRVLPGYAATRPAQVPHERRVCADSVMAEGKKFNVWGT